MHFARSIVLVTFVSGAALALAVSSACKSEDGTAQDDTEKKDQCVDSLAGMIGRACTTAAFQCTVPYACVGRGSLTAACTCDGKKFNCTDATKRPINSASEAACFDPTTNPPDCPTTAQGAKGTECATPMQACAYVSSTCPSGFVPMESCLCNPQTKDGGGTTLAYECARESCPSDLDGAPPPVDSGPGCTSIVFGGLSRSIDVSYADVPALPDDTTITSGTYNLATDVVYSDAPDAGSITDAGDAGVGGSSDGGKGSSLGERRVSLRLSSGSFVEWIESGTQGSFNEKGAYSVETGTPNRITFDFTCGGDPRTYEFGVDFGPTIVLRKALAGGGVEVLTFTPH